MPDAGLYIRYANSVGNSVFVQDLIKLFLKYFAEYFNATALPILRTDTIIQFRISLYTGTVSVFDV